jgi:N-acetylglucosamine-6-phosphate deacetylase
MITLAPERLEAVAMIPLARELGMTVSLGHTNAPRKRLVQAQKAGATAFTHLGNGCPRDLDRADNILWRVFETPGLRVSLIPDAIHVSSPLFRIAHKVLPAESIFYVSDAMAAADAAPGRYRIGRLEVEVGEDEIVRLPGSANYAGSALRPIDGIFRAAEMLRCSWRDVWPRYSHVPASLVGPPISACSMSRRKMRWKSFGSTSMASRSRRRATYIWCIFSHALSGKGTCEARAKKCAPKGD